MIFNLSAAGMVSVGQQAYIGLGAYGLWALVDQAGVHPFAALPLAALGAAIISIPTALLLFRLRGGYFAIGTWVMAEVYRLTVSNIRVSGGGSGTTISGVQRMIPDVDTRMFGIYLLALVAAVGAVTAVYFLLRSRLGLSLTSIRDNEVAAESLGVHVFRSKLYIYIIAAFGCAFAGSVYYLNQLRVQPDAAFGINWTAFVIFIVIIGGVGTIEGPILGAVIFYVLQETLAAQGTWYLIILGTVAIVVTVVSPGGLWGLVIRRWNLHLFPVQRLLKLEMPVSDPESAEDATCAQ